ncbi:hypothetical protein [Leptolyngbya sp. FACHB-261]|uniref:hypothetical protein n=1 Tax=Leptolyngbya sp. FACHB-261 TaxID=2692806 RepID=UPI0016878C8E|nr:hypothetical protein [Leptolyngbya sp. FACHB-261]MBD2101554.1 hypothetical protein [Leptolyngbya sp. FACHB-261]
MLGRFQQSHLRIEINASEETLSRCLLKPATFSQWLWPQQFSPDLPETLTAGVMFTDWLGPVAVQHRVEAAQTGRLLLTLWQGIDGFHEWRWGEGWVQSRLEGISLLPLNLGQTLSLARLRQYLATQAQS